MGFQEQSNYLYYNYQTKQQTKGKSNMKNNNNYKTYSINGVVINGEEVRNVMRTNRFVGEHVGAITRDGNFFTEREARSILLLDSDNRLQKDGTGNIGVNVKVMCFKKKLSIEAQKMMAEGLMNM